MKDKGLLFLAIGFIGHFIFLFYGIIQIILGNGNKPVDLFSKTTIAVSSCFLIIGCIISLIKLIRE